MERFRKTLTFCLGACGAVLFAGTVAGQTPAETTRSGAGVSRLERGRYLVTILSCNDCHTPFKMGPQGPEPDMSRMLSGHPESMKLPPPPAPAGPWIWAGSASNTAYAGPWGVSYASNLTPDPNTGLGIWTEEMFLKMMKTGKHMGVSREVQPPMPWPWYGKAEDEDLKAVFAYLKSIPPIVNHVPDWQPPAPAKAASSKPAPAKK
jgi:hypothetical protein